MTANIKANPFDQHDLIESLWYSQWDSNPYFYDFESYVSADWTTRAWQTGKLGDCQSLIDTFKSTIFAKDTFEASRW